MPWDLAIGRFGRIDVLVCSAGIFIANAMTDEYRIEDFDRTLRSNIRSAFLMTKFALPRLREAHGSIVYMVRRPGSTVRRCSRRMVARRGFCTPS